MGHIVRLAERDTEVAHNCVSRHAMEMKLRLRPIADIFEARHFEDHFIWQIEPDLPPLRAIKSIGRNRSQFADCAINQSI